MHLPNFLLNPPNKTKAVNLMKRIILLCAALVGSTAFAAQAPNDIEILVKSGKFAEAETALVQAVKDNPESYKAHNYLQQIYAKNGKANEARLEALKANAIKEKKEAKERAKVMLIALSILGGISVLIAVIFGYNWREERKARAAALAAESKQKETTRRSLLTQAIQAKGDIEDSILILKAKNVKGQLMDDFVDIKKKSLDAIEILSEKGDYEESDIISFLRNAADGVRHVNRLYS